MISDKVDMKNILTSSIATLCDLLRKSYQPILSDYERVAIRRPPPPPSLRGPAPCLCAIVCRYRVNSEDGDVTSVDLRHAISDDTWQASPSKRLYSIDAQQQEEYRRTIMLVCDAGRPSTRGCRRAGSAAPLACAAAGCGRRAVQRQRVRHVHADRGPQL